MSKNDFKVTWGHQGSIGKFHVDLISPDGSQSHHHSPTLYPPVRDKNGAIKIKSWDQMPAPWGPIK